MPMIMDDQSYNMDVDDLFGDSEQVSITTIPPPPVKGLELRLVELQNSGCCQRIAWSKSSCVAYITPDGHGVHLRIYARDPASGKWELGKETPLEILHSSHDDLPLVHLSWSHLGNDLAVMNAAGHVMIYSCSMVLDRMTPVKTDASQPESETEAVVGMSWLAILPYEHKSQIAWSASNKGTSWGFHIVAHVFRDPHHPDQGKAAMIYLRRNGELRVRCQMVNGSWSENWVSLSTMSSVGDAFSHAAFASNGDNALFLTAYNQDCHLHLWSIELTWSVPQPKQGQQPRPYPPPEIVVTNLGIREDCFPTASSVTNGDLNGGESKFRLPAQLTHLSFLASTPDKTDGTLPTIHAIFATYPNMAGLEQSQAPHVASHSVMLRWEVHQITRNTLHPSLDKLASKKKSVGSVPPRQETVLKRLDDIMFHSIVLSFFPLWYNMTLAFIFSDGSIEFRKRATLETIGPDYNTQTVTSLPQAGFAFSVLEPLLHVSLSPNHCIAVGMQQDGSIKLRPMEYTYGSLASDEEDPKHSAALTALILQTASAANQYFSSDDVFAVMGDLSEKRKNDFIDLMFQGLGVNIDCGLDDINQNTLMLLGRSPTFVKTLSAAHLLGLQNAVTRSVPSKIAWLILNVKYVTQIITTIARMHGQIDKHPLRPEVVPQFIGICRWAVHFMAFMVDELWTLGRSLRDIPSDSLTRATIEQKIQDENHAAILILLSSFPRSMINQWHHPLRWASKSAYMAMHQGKPPPEVRQIYTALQQALSDCPFDWPLFEKYVQEAHHLVHQCYKHAGLKEQQRNEVEREIILGRVPDVLLPATKRLLGESLFGDGALLDKLDPAKVRYFDTTWLGFTHSKNALEWHDTHVVDVCQKMIVRGLGAQSHIPGIQAAQSGRERSDSNNTTNGEGGKSKKGVGRLRRCTRCNAHMEDALPGQPGSAPNHATWVTSAAKHCICGNAWVLAQGWDRDRYRK